MPFSYAKMFGTKETPQSSPIPGSNQVANNAGGFSFAVDDWTRLDRFLTLGSESSSYYASERQLTVENAQAVVRCIKENGPEVVRRIVAVSTAGRAPKNDPAVFALALVAAFGDQGGKSAAYAALSDVCRIGTHLFQFAEACNSLRGWGSGLRRAIASWYASKDAKDLAFQVAKYQQRNGWSHRDLLRLSHPRFDQESSLQTIAHWVVRGWDGVGEAPHPDESLLLIWAFERAKRAATESEIVRLIRDYRLPRECVPTQWLNSQAVWEALLEHMPLTAMVRNLGKMSAIGLLVPLSGASHKVCDALGSEATLRKARVHPLSLLVAQKTYAQGHGDKGSLKWAPVSQVVDALDAAFYGAFGAVEPTGKRWLLALDVSGSMGSAFIGGLSGIDCRTASAAMSLVTANVEREHHIVAFTTNGWTGWYRSQWAAQGFNNGISPLDISPRQRLSDVVAKVKSLRMGGTDCALPMLYAAEHKLQVDAFVVYTDSETWAGNVHPVQALRQYREKTGIPAKLIVCGMVSSGFSVADPADAGMMDCVGFDLAAPAVMADFVRAA